jgi:hypothetical protein
LTLFFWQTGNKNLNFTVAMAQRKFYGVFRWNF